MVVNLLKRKKSLLVSLLVLFSLALLGLFQQEIKQAYVVYSSKSACKNLFNEFAVNAANDESSVITLSDDTCVKVSTLNAVYFYDKVGGGFASIIDNDGNDWISWKPGGRSAGEFRGIPNLGGCCHPGYTGHQTDVEQTKSDYAKIRTQKDGYSLHWEFYADRATLTVERAAEQIYLLYEGTPGGSLGNEDNYFSSAGEESRNGLLASKNDIDFDFVGDEWIVFEDSKLNRGLILIHHENDTVRETYWTMDNQMTVFGFGRTCAGACQGLSAPQKMTIAFLDKVNFVKAELFAKQVLADAN